MSIFIPRSREQKLVDCIFPYFGEYAKAQRSDGKALDAINQLLNIEGKALKSPVLADFLDNWSRDFPEECDVTEHELHWSLMHLESHLSKQLYQVETGGTQNPAPEHAKKRLRVKAAKAKFGVINGGKSDKPDRPVD